MELLGNVEEYLALLLVISCIQSRYHVSKRASDPMVCSNVFDVQTLFTSASILGDMMRYHLNDIQRAKVIVGARELTDISQLPTPWSCAQRGRYIEDGGSQHRWYNTFIAMPDANHKII